MENRIFSDRKFPLFVYVPMVFRYLLSCAIVNAGRLKRFAERMKEHRFHFSFDYFL